MKFYYVFLCLIADWNDNSELNIHQAWSELSYIEREQERYVALRSATVRDLDQCRQRAALLENVIMPNLLGRNKIHLQ